MTERTNPNELLQHMQEVYYMTEPEASSWLDTHLPKWRIPKKLNIVYNHRTDTGSGAKEQKCES